MGSRYIDARAAGAPSTDCGRLSLVVVLVLLLLFVLVVLLVLVAALPAVPTPATAVGIFRPPLFVSTIGLVTVVWPSWPGGNSTVGSAYAQQ